ncbi:protein kinase domain-containing protein [Geothrix fuzhouensis]|uniref:protein kinase domain-containing protein n=1 Tax=Geothrix fuzhouensis TaxID=2966451 RepID=UPI0021493111|nr:protein kinase [Geothrix fuzhouensis]
MVVVNALVGKSVAHYRITRQLGSGGMGIVYEAEDTHLGRHVAVKFLSEELQRDASILERFQREARAASTLNHPGICTVHTIEQHEGQHFIVMELIEGQTLAKRISHRALDLPETLDLGIQIADALESAHAKGIVHRDLKPLNLILNVRGQIKILDFGLAKISTLTNHLGAADQDSRLATEVDRGDLTFTGMVLGTMHYMSPEQARGQLTDARTDLFSLGAILYQMVTGELPFQGDTQAVVFDAILNRDPQPLAEVRPEMPAALGQVISKALEKDRNLRYQTATDLKTDLLRLKRDLDSGQRHLAELTDSKGGSLGQAKRSVAVLYFQNLSGAKEDEYFRDGITEDIITELSKIQGLETFSRSTVIGYRDKSATTAQIGQQIGAAYALEGSIRRAGERLRINAQLVDTHTDHPVWSERYDREMKDVFEVQDEIARKIAEALRVKLTPQEKKALAAKPTENLQAYDHYLRGRSYARRLTRQDLEFALEMFNDAVRQDPDFAQAHAAIANVCAQCYWLYEREPAWIERARAASEKAVALRPDLPEVMVAQAWILYSRGENLDAAQIVRGVVSRKRDCEGAYYLLLRCLFGSGQYQEIAAMAEEAIEASGTDYNVYPPIMNALGALAKKEALGNLRIRAVQAFEAHLREVPEDARARGLVASYYAELGRAEEAKREAMLAMTLRPNEPLILYNAACTFCKMHQKGDALDALGKAWRVGYRDSDWAWRDPDLALLHDEPEFEKLFPRKA